MNEVEIAIQVMGKVRSHIMIPLDASKEQVLELVLADEKTALAIGDKPVRRFIYIPEKLVNIVI